MKVFYLFSNWKWTGPAEPALNMAGALAKKGVDLHFFPGTPPAGDSPLVGEKAQERGLHCRGELTLKKHLHLLHNFLDYRRLKKLIRQETPQILHTNLPNDHLLATLARGRNQSIKIIRSLYDESLSKPHYRNRFLLRRGTDALVTISNHAQKNLLEQYDHLRGKSHLVDVGVDLERFSPHRPLPDLRKKWAFEPEHFVVGLVARMQFHRRFPLFLQALAEGARKYPHLRVMIVGRGTHAEKVAREPVRNMGLEKVVTFAGYLQGDEYVGALKAFDLAMLMVPGSDSSCRAIREAMAMGKPLLVGNTGVLPELIQKSGGGKFFDYTPESLGAGLSSLVEDHSLCVQCGQKSLQYAQDHFSPEKGAHQIIQIYKQLVL